MSFTLSNLSLRLPDSNWPLLESGNLSFDWGVIVSLMGDSGSGKSSLLRALSGLQESEGEILLGGQDQKSFAPEVYRSKVSYLSQAPFFVPGTVEYNLMKPFEWGVYNKRDFDTEFLNTILDHVGWNKALLNKDIFDLSGGEQQMVALLRGLILGPQVLLLDEPTSSFDEKLTLRVEALLKEWVGAEKERLLILVTHSEEQARRMASLNYKLESAQLIEV